MDLKSRAFGHGGRIPSLYTCEGRDISPPLEIADVPKGTAALALLMDDPDAPMGAFDHWVVWNIPADTAEIPEGKEPKGVQGRTGFGRPGYGGPCPPTGTHRYQFKLYALDQELKLAKGASKVQLEAAMKGHILAQTMLEGKYQRTRR